MFRPSPADVSVCLLCQGLLYQTLRASEFLSEQEQDVLRWGRNANVKVPKRFSQSGMHGQTYKEATAIECLVRAALPLALPAVFDCATVLHCAGLWISACSWGLCDSPAQTPAAWGAIIEM